jgi:NTP pyrophosphatase (non-canonical NTP hydrolase)
MDLNSLQMTLRRFAAERAWGAFHTPKNLAMALVVEAAELAEIFQWLTPEQSALARGDAVLQERVADELADVLLYLVQIADHTAVDLERAVERKLLKNARKYPAARMALPATIPPAGSTPPSQVHVLVDWENVQPKEGDIRALVPAATHLWLFHGPSQKNVGAHHASFGERATMVQIARSGKNALDFHLSFDLGYLAARQPEARFVVISNDKGYGPMLEHAAQLGFQASQMSFGGRKVRAAVKRPAAKKAAPRKRVTVEPTAVKKAAPKLPSAAAQPRRMAATKTPAKKLPATKPSTPKTPVRKAPAVAKPAETALAAPAKKAPRARAARGSAPVPRQAQPQLAKAANGNRADLEASVQRVLADLTKMGVARRPAKQARLLAYIGSMLASNADDPVVHSVLAQLLASARVSVNGKGEVQYAL